MSKRECQEVGCSSDGKALKRAKKDNTEVNHFILNRESRKHLLNSTRNYSSIHISFDNILREEANFLEPIIAHLDSLTSLSFEGTIEESCIDHFFKKLDQKDARPRFKVKNITLLGDDINGKNLLQKLFDIKLDIKGKYECYESLTLNGASAENVCEIFSIFIRSKKIVLRNINFTTLDIQLKQPAVYLQPDVIELISEKVDQRTLEYLKSFCPALKQISPELHSYGFYNSTIGRSPFSNNNDALKIICPDVHYLIFQHFDLEALLDVSEFSKDWFELTSETIGKKFKIELNDVGANYILKRNCYKNISIKIDDDKKSYASFDASQSLNELTIEVSTQESSFVEQRLSEVFNEIHVLSLNNRYFCLKFLMINCSANEGLALDNMNLPTTLNILHLTNCKLTSMDPVTTSFYKFLVNARDLKEVHFDRVTGLEKIFSTDLSANFPAKLRALSLPIFFHDSKFLSKQLGTLIELNVDEIQAKTLPDISNSKLESLKCGQVKGSLIGYTRGLARNVATLSKLEISSRFSDFELISMLFPKLRTISIEFLELSNFNFFLENFRELEEICFERRSRTIFETYQNCYVNGNRKIKITQK